MEFSIIMFLWDLIEIFSVSLWLIHKKLSFLAGWQFFIYLTLLQNHLKTPEKEKEKENSSNMVVQILIAFSTKSVLFTLTKYFSGVISFCSILQVISGINKGSNCGYHTSVTFHWTVIAICLHLFFFSLIVDSDNLLIKSASCLRLYMTIVSARAK